MSDVFHSLRFRLLLLVLLALVPAVGLVLYTAWAQRQLAATQAQEHALQLARAAATSQTDLVESTREILLILSEVPSIRDNDPAACETFLANVLKKYPRYTTFVVKEPDGNVRCNAVSSNAAADRASAPSFQRVLETREFAIGELRIGPNSRKNTLAFGYPILDAEHQIQAVILASLDLDWLNQLAAQAQLPAGSTITVYDRNRTIVARYPEPEKWVGQSFPAAPITQLVFGNQNEGTAEAIGEDRVLRLYAFTPMGGVPSDGTFVSVGIPAAVVFADVDTGLQRDLTTLGLMAVLTLGAAWIGSDWFLLRQMRLLQRATNRLADGDLSARASLPFGVGELNQLGRAFDKMGRVLEQRESERKEAEEQLRRWTVELEALLNTLAQAISQPLDISHIADIALAKTLAALDLQAGCILLKGSESPVVVAHRGLAGIGIEHLAKMHPGNGRPDPAAELVNSAVIQNIPPQALPRALASTGTDFPCWFSVPVKSKGHVFGVMCLASRTPRQLQPHELGVLAAIGQQVGVAIENAKLYEQVQSIAALKERERLSRELHDGLVQVLGYLCMKSQITETAILARDLGSASMHAEDIRRTVMEAYEDARESVLGLRMTVPPHSELVATLQEHIHKFSLQTGIDVTLVSNAPDRFNCPAQVQVQLLRIIHEALSNVRKHSGATQAWVTLDAQAESIQVTIKDLGKGFDPIRVNHDGQQHLGLQTMRERAEEIAGRLQVISQPGGGTQILFTSSLVPEGE